MRSRMNILLGQLVTHIARYEVTNLILQYNPLVYSLSFYVNLKFIANMKKIFHSRGTSFKDQRLRNLSRLLKNVREKGNEDSRIEFKK